MTEYIIINSCEDIQIGDWVSRLGWPLTEDGSIEYFEVVSEPVDPDDELNGLLNESCFFLSFYDFDDQEWATAPYILGRSDFDLQNPWIKRYQPIEDILT